MKFHTFLLLLLSPFVLGHEEFIPKPGVFAPASAGHYHAGELVSIDHVNRRGGLRLDGDGNSARYQAAPSHFFSLLPYATLRYQGATADLVHIPLGTHLHGTFVLPPEGDTTVPAPRKDDEKWVPPHNYALLLEDDVSFYQRRGQAWRIDSVDPAKNALTATLTGPDLPGGLKGKKTFSIDGSTRIWKDNSFGAIADIHPAQSVQISLAWLPDWEFGDFHLADIWLDAESLKQAATRQSELHKRHATHRWLPGWINHVEHLPDAKGIITFTPFAGQDPAMYELLKKEAAKNGGASLAAAEPTLRTWQHYHDSKNGSIIDLKEIPDAPPGSSGVQVRVNVSALIDGYRPGRVARMRLHGFSTKGLPAEERMRRLDQR